MMNAEVTRAQVVSTQKRKMKDNLDCLATLDEESVGNMFLIPAKQEADGWHCLMEVFDFLKLPLTLASGQGWQKIDRL